MDGVRNTLPEEGDALNVLFPESLADACAMLAQHRGSGALVPMAGATDLLVHWPGRQADHDKSYLDLSGVTELRSITWTDATLVLGALTTYWDVLQDSQAAGEFPLLIEAARQVGAVQIQTRGTWAGNIANGSPAADGVPVLMALDASVTLASTTGTRTVPLDAYYTGYRTSVRRSDELIVSIEIPRRAHDLAAFYKVGPRRAQAITKVGVAIARSTAGWRIVANSVAPTVCRCRTVEQLLHAATPIKSPDGFLTALAADVAPIDDIRSTADYRKTVLARLLYHGLRGRTPSVR
jgi:CO/xanthine dehydrogenase FAD-binding subunit